jgi:hypothetical protein
LESYYRLCDDPREPPKIISRVILLRARWGNSIHY